MTSATPQPLFCDSTDLEFHIPGMNFCGPGTDLQARLEDDGKTPKLSSQPVDRVDEISLRHDLFYEKHKNAAMRCQAVKEMIDELKLIRDPTWRERVERAIAIFCLTIKRFVVLLFLRLMECFIASVRQ